MSKSKSNKTRPILQMNENWKMFIDILVGIAIGLFIGLIIMIINKPDSLDSYIVDKTLMLPSDNWNKTFGNSIESKLCYNIWLCEQAIKEQKKKIKEIETIIPAKSIDELKSE